MMYHTVQCIVSQCTARSLFFWQVMRCNAHKECPVMLRASEDKRTDMWRPQVLDVSHSLEPNDFRRKNSALTHSQQKAVEDLVANGSKPMEMMQQANLDQIKKGVVEKNPAGNQVGACQLDEARGYVDCVADHRNVLIQANTI